MPWQTKQQRESTGSGFIVEGRRILTNAHCVADQVCTGIGAFPSDLTPFQGTIVLSWNRVRAVPGAASSSRAAASSPMPTALLTRCMLCVQGYLTCQKTHPPRTLP